MSLVSQRLMIPLFFCVPFKSLGLLCFFPAEVRRSEHKSCPGCKLFISAAVGAVSSPLRNVRHLIAHSGDPPSLITAVIVQASPRRWNGSHAGARQPEISAMWGEAVPDHSREFEVAP